MKPQRVVARRAASPNARHQDVALVRCDAPVTLHLTVSPIRGYTHLVVVRCPVCDTAVRVEGVRDPEADWADTDGDVNTWGVG